MEITLSRWWILVGSKWLGGILHDMAYVGLVDCNNFFVSCERLFRPDLAKCPVVVLSSNDGCVVARSQEIKDRGIAMGVPYFQIKDILSDIEATVFSSHFALYRDISNRVFSILRKRLGEIEQYSIDECFFMTKLGSDEVLSLGIELQELVQRQVGIPVSVGFASSKTQAKFANNLAKKTKGCYLLSPTDWQEKISTINLSEIWGVGEGRFRQFKANSLLTVADFLNLNTSVIERLFGVEGLHLHAELSGKNAVRIETDKATPKTIMNSRSFAKEVKDRGVILRALLYHLHELIKELEHSETKALKIRLLMQPSRYSNFAFQGSSVETLLSAPSRDIFELSKVITKLVNEHFRKNIPYKKVGIVASVISEKALTKTLFNENITTRDLTEVLTGLNARFGKKALRLGNLADSLTKLSSTKLLSPEYTTRWSDIKLVKA